MDLTEKLNKLKTLEGTDFETALQELKANHCTPEELEVIKTWMTKDCDGIEAELLDINSKLDEMLIREQLRANYEILPISYIAKNYFRKSTSWLYQRINGTKVRGRIYTLNDQERKVFNTALQELSKRIGSVSI